MHHGHHKRTSSSTKSDVSVTAKLTHLVRDGVKLGFLLAGEKNTSALNDKNMKVLSPRFLSLRPENENGSEDMITDEVRYRASSHNRVKFQNLLCFGIYLSFFRLIFCRPRY